MTRPPEEESFRRPRSDSDLDIALEFQNVDEDDAELTCNRVVWKAELAQITGITVRDIYHLAAAPVMAGPECRSFHKRYCTTSGQTRKGIDAEAIVSHFKGCFWSVDDANVPYLY